MSSTEEIYKITLVRILKAPKGVNRAFKEMSIRVLFRFRHLGA